LLLFSGIVGLLSVLDNAAIVLVIVDGLLEVLSNLLSVRFVYRMLLGSTCFLCSSAVII